MVLEIKNPPANVGDIKRLWFDPWFWKIPSRKATLPIPVFLSGESPGQRNLMGYSPQGHKQSDKTEAT